MFCKSSNHQTNDPSSPERTRQKEIKQLRSFQNISYYEAGEKYPDQIGIKIYITIVTTISRTYQ